MRPLAIDLYAGLGGWSSGLIDAGFRVVGFDVERHAYGGHAYPGQLVLQDVRTLRGSQLKDAALIVASPPCTEFSYMAMPWKRAKRIAAALRGEGDFPDGYRGSRTVAELTELFDACCRIREEASAAAGRRIPLVVENVRGAQPWVGRAEWAYGSYFLWGDVPALMPITSKRAASKNPGFRFDGSGRSFQTAAVDGVKVGGLDWSRHGEPGYAAGPGRCFRDSAIKLESADGRRTDPGKGARFTSRDCGLEGAKQPGLSGPRANGRGDRWFQDGAARHGSTSAQRRAASALIAKIPYRLARWIGDVYAQSARSRA